MANNNLDLNELANRPDHQVTINLTSADPLERESSIRIKEADAQHARYKELLLHGLAAATILVVVLLCVWNVGRRGLATDEGKLAFGLLTTIVSSLLSYVAGKSSK